MRRCDQHPRHAVRHLGAHRHALVAGVTVLPLGPAEPVGDLLVLHEAAESNFASCTICGRSGTPRSIAPSPPVGHDSEMPCGTRKPGLDWEPHVKGGGPDFE